MTSHPINRIPMPDLRKRRAESFASVIMSEIDDVAPEADKAVIFYRLLDVLLRNGACWTTDEERAKMGFEPRDHEGWTASERIERKRQEVELLTSLIDHRWTKDDDE